MERRRSRRARRSSDGSCRTRGTRSRARCAIPVGSYDPVENRWEHEGVARWDGARFAVPVTHFTTYDGNAADAGDLLLVLTREPSPNAGASKCGMGSSWRVVGGSLDQSFALPSMRVRGQDVSLSLHYASGLAGTRKLGAPPDNTAAPSVVPRGSFAVSAPGVKITAQCVARGGGAPSAMQPGSCSSIGGSCGLGGGGGTAMGSQIDMLAATLHQLRTLPAQAKEAEFGGWVEIPLATPEQVTGPGLVSQRISVKGDGLSACAASGGTFGVSDPMGPRVQLSGVEAGAYMTVTRKVLVHHRFSSPYGAGWAVREVSRLYVDGDVAHLVSGEGQEEQFRPRARVKPVPDNLGEQAVARDPRTGEIFAAVMPGRIARLDPVTGAPTDVLSGLAFSTTFVHALTIGYVGSVRHFVVATATALLDIDGGGNKRTLASRAHFGNTLYNQASVAAHDDVVFYTSGDDATPVLYRARLSDAVPALEVLSATAGDTRLYPREPLTSMQFAAPRGLAFAQDGSLLVADPRRHVVYGVYPSVSGTIEPTSNVHVVLGMGAGRYVAAVGERQPALAYSINQPVRLAVAEDGIVLVMNSYGITAFDPVAREAELLFLENGRDEIVASLAGIEDLTPSAPTSFVALTSTSMFSRTINHGLVRVDVEPLASTQDPTRVLRRLPGASGGFELTDTTAAKVWRFDALGRMLEQRERTGEIDFTVRYDDPQRARVDAIVDAVGGEHVFTYGGPGDKLSAIRDPAGRITTLTIDERGDLVRVVEPDGEVRTFTYDAHRMVTKTSPRGDVTLYTYRDDGTVATSTKPGGETYSFEPALGAAPSYDAAGASVRSGAYTDARGVRHTFRTDKFGGIDEETYTADGVTRTLRAVHPETVGSFDEPVAAVRRNAFLRTSHYTLNGVPLSAPIKFDSLGRPSRQQRIFGHGIGSLDIHRWDYAPDGWLVEAFSGPASYAQRIERDAAGHVMRIFDAVPRSGGLNPTGRQTSFSAWRPDGQPETMTEHGVTTTFTYDDAGSHNLIGSVDTLGRTLSLGYDAYGNLTSTSDGTASATFVFDVANRLRTSRDALGHETTFRYEHVGCGCSERDEITGVHTPDLAAGVEWTMSYGPQGRLAGVTDPHGLTEVYTYEATGEVKTVIDRLNRTTTMQHDELGRLLAVVDTLGRRQGLAYSVPGSGTWNGPTLTAGGADGSAAASTLAAPLRDGDYQLGVNALDVEGFPAQISLYRDATFALGHTHFFDNAGRPTGRRDRVGMPIESATLPVGSGRGSFVDETHGWEPGTASPVMALTASASGAFSSIESADYRRNVEYDLTSTDGFWGGAYAIVSKETLTPDAGGRVKSNSRRLYNIITPVVSTYEYRLDGRLGRVTNPDGIHDFTYDTRGLLATQAILGEGVYTYGYDEVGRSTTVTFPDGHVRRQVFDDLGRITSRCYEYPGNASLNRCYGAQYDAVGNPVRLTDPEGADVLVYDVLDRLKSVTREEGGVTVGVETYDFNALGALKVNAGVALDHRRPRLDGTGMADAAVPASLSGLPVTLDAGGRVTSLRGTTLTWNTRGQLREAAPPIPAEPKRYGIDSQMRRFARIQGSNVELYVYEGDDRIAVLDGSGATKETYLFAGIDDPLRMRRGTAVTVYFELDLAGNVRHLRGTGGTDLGGYRYTAFGKTLEDDALVDQPLRWKGRWHQNIGGSEIYDVRARQWSPELGSFLSIDEYRTHDRSSTFWGWPKQSPERLRDPSGRGPFVEVGVGAGVGVDDYAVGGQVSVGVIFSDGIANRFTSSGSISGGVGATMGASAELGYALDNKAFFGAGEQLTFSLWNFSINLKFTKNGDLSAFSGAYGMSTGNEFGIFHSYTQTPGTFISAEELDEMERNATEPLTGQQCEFYPGVTALPE